MNLVNKILDFLGGNPFETEEEYENRLICKELNKKIKSLQRYNKHNLIENQIKPFLNEQFFQQNNVYPSYEQLEKMALNAFKQSKDLGYIDCLNKKIGDE